MLVLKKLLKYLVLFKVISQVMSEVSMADMRRFASCKEFNFMKILNILKIKKSLIRNFRFLIVRLKVLIFYFKLLMVVQKYSIRAFV